MDYRDAPKLMKGVMYNKALPYHILYNTGRYTVHPLERRLLDGRSLAPRSISVMITDRCNMRCRMCQYSHAESDEFHLNRAGFMSLDLFERILDTCPGRPMIALTGGEPLLHPQVMDFIGALKQRGFFCSLTTNGTFLKAKAAELCKSKLDLLVVSIDGDQSIHDQIRSQGAYQRAVAGIQEILKLPGRPMVGIATVIMDSNHTELEKSLNLAESLGVDVLHFNHLWIHTDQMVQEQQNQTDLPQTGRVLWKVNTQAIDSDRVYESLRSIRGQKHRVVVHEYPELSREQTRIYYRKPEQLVKVRSTRCAWQVMRIYPDGEVGICREYHAGNVQNEPLREIWNNKRYRDFRRYLREKGTCPICSRCCHVFSRM